MRQIRKEGRTWRYRIDEGEWVDDMQEGKGIEKLEDGSIYEGQFKNGKKWGVGVYKWAD